jgi:hypothetical protein
MANQPGKLTCTVCGSTFFTTARAEQFVAGGYGSAEFRSISNSPKTVLTCVGCSTPVTPAPAYYSRGTVAGVAEEEFRKSIEAGQKYREDKNTIGKFVSPSELNEVRDLALDVKKAVEAQSKPKSPKPKQAVEEHHVANI